MKIAALIARILLGLLFLIFGSNGFLGFIKPSANQLPTGLAGDFNHVMMTSHYMHVVSGVMVISAVLFLVGRFVPLALVLIGPVLVNILLFHMLLLPQGIQVGLFATLCWFVVFFYHRAAFAGIFQAQA